jgi:hypothetical protein
VRAPRSTAASCRRDGKPLPLAGLAFARQLLAGVYPVRPAVESALGAFAAPRAAIALAHEVYGLELRDELAEIRRRRIPTTVPLGHERHAHDLRALPRDRAPRRR